jgi:hypothetical protein
LSFEILFRGEDSDALEGMEAKQVIVVREKERCVAAKGEGEKFVVLGVNAGSDCHVGGDNIYQIPVVIYKSKPEVEGNAIKLGTKDDFAKLRESFFADKQTMDFSEMIDC